MPEKCQRKAKTGIFSLLLLLLLLLFLISVPLWKEEVRSAIFVCGTSLIPVLFPFLILSDLLTHTAAGQNLLALLSTPFSRLLRTEKAGASAYLIGILLGFPLGVKAICGYYKQGFLEKEEAERLLLFCNNTGPAFLIGSVGGMLGSPKKGLLLYLTQILITLFFGFLAGKKRPKSAHKEKRIPMISDFSFPAAVRRASIQMLSICGYVLFFSALCAMLFPFLPVFLAKAMLAATMEIGGATAFISANAGKAGLLLLPLLGFASCFSGLSVFFQAREFLLDTNLSSYRMLPAKLLQGGICFAVLWLFVLCGFPV